MKMVQLQVKTCRKNNKSYSHTCTFCVYVKFSSSYVCVCQSCDCDFEHSNYLCYDHC